MISSLISSIINLPQPLLHSWGYWVLIAVAIFESIPLIGNFIPGNLIVIFGGFLARLHIIDVGDAIIFASLGAIVGDTISYLLGIKYGEKLIIKYGKYFFFKPEYLDKTKKLVNEHPGKALIIGRFNSVTRSFAPFVAGVARLPKAKFFLYNLIGGISWAAVAVGVGYLFGQSYEVGAKFLGKFIFIGVLAIIALVITYRFVNKQQQIFKKYHLHTLSLLLISIYVFSKMAEDFIDRERITHLDLYINTHLPYIWNITLTSISLFVTKFGGPWYLFSSATLIIIFLIIKKRWYETALLSISMIGGGLLELLFKAIFHRPRPILGLIQQSGWAFPSGHATIATLFFAALIFCFKNSIKNKITRRITVSFAIFLFLLISFSRIYLGVHWLSDVIGGIALGLAWVTFTVLVLQFISYLKKNSDEGFKLFYRR